MKSLELSRFAVPSDASEFPEYSIASANKLLEIIALGTNSNNFIRIAPRGLSSLT